MEPIQFLGLFFFAVVLYVIVGFAIKIYAVVTERSRLMRLTSHIPGPEGHKYLGMLPDMVKNGKRTNDYILDLMKQYGGSGLTVRLPPPIFRNFIEVFTMDPVLIKRMLHDEFDTYTKTIETNEFSYYFKRWLGEGIFATAHGPFALDKGDGWKMQRKIAAGIFTKNNFKMYMRETFAHHGQQFINVVDKAIDLNEPVDLQKMFFSFTMDSIMEIFFARKTETLQNKQDPYAIAFDESQRQMFKIFDYFYWFLIARVAPWPLGGAYGLIQRFFRATNKHCIEFEKCVQIMDKVSQEIVDERRSDLEKLENSTDLLALFMNTKDDEGVPLYDPKYSQFLRDLIVNLIIAGRDTTACTLTWTFYLLSQNKDCREKLLEEVDRVLGDNPPNFESVAATNMPYLHGVITEALRLYPPVPRDSKRCYKDDVLPDGRVIPRGTILVFFPYGIGHSDHLFKNPEKFDPTRWQELGLNFAKTNQYEFPVFQAGYRICLGMDMAMFEGKLLTAMLCQHFIFDLKEGEAEKITYSRMITMSLSNGADSHNLWMIAKRRNKNKKPEAA